MSGDAQDINASTNKTQAGVPFTKNGAMYPEIISAKTSFVLHIM